MRFHVVGLPNAPTSKKNCWCAYGAKCLKFAAMMTARGHEVFHYGVEGSEVVCAQHRDILSRDDFEAFFGGHDPGKSYSPIIWDTKEPYWQIANARAAYWIKRQMADKGDFVCLVGGACQKPIADALANCGKLHVVTEPFIGYFGTFCGHRVFESYAHMHNVYGKLGGDPDGSIWDAVIPNYFDTDDFTYVEKPQDYCLYMGRMIQRKGIATAVEATRIAGKRLLLCGQGIESVSGNTIRADGMTLTGDHIEYVGTADVAKRDELMGNALCLLAPTKYIGPFEGVAVECQITGTPAIVTDWGAFAETVEHGVSGYRCRTMGQFVWAIQHAHELDRKAISERARRLYSLEKVGAMYEEYFSMLQTHFGIPPKPRTELDWLKR